MIRFYGFSLLEVESMNVYDLQSFVEAIQVIRAKEMLNDIAVASFPYASKTEREKIENRLRRASGEINSFTFDQMMRLQNG